MDLGNKIKEIRTKFGLTQEDLAEKLNVSRQAIAKWESGNGIPDTENLKTISKLFGTSIDTLLDNEADIPLIMMHHEFSGNRKSRREQFMNFLAKHFDDTWTEYVLFYDNGLFKGTDFATLKIKDNEKILITVSRSLTSIDVYRLNSNTDIKNIKIGGRKYSILYKTK